MIQPSAQRDDKLRGVQLSIVGTKQLHVLTRPRTGFESRLNHLRNLSCRVVETRCIKHRIWTRTGSGDGARMARARLQRMMA